MKLAHQIGVLRVGFDEEGKGLTVELDIDPTALPEYISENKRKAAETICAFAHRAACEAMKHFVGPHTESTTSDEAPDWMKNRAKSDMAGLN